LEPHSSSSTEDSAREDLSDSDHAILEVSPLVPNNQVNGNRGPDPNTASGRTASTGGGTQLTGQKSTLVALRLANKRRRLIDEGWSEEALKIVLESDKAIQALEGYAGPQGLYMAWATLRGIDALTPNTTEIVNWLASGVALGKWQPSTVWTYFKAIVQLYETPAERATISGNADVKNFLRRVNGNAIKDIRELDIDLTPIRVMLIQQDITTLSTLELSQQLCWFLTVLGALRPDSIQCIDLSDKRFAITEHHVILPVRRPKETRGGQPIVWALTMLRHTDPRLCPVATIREYLSRIQDHYCYVQHPKASTEFYTPLVRNCKDPTKPLSKDRISNNARVIARLMPLPPGTSLPRGRAVGTTAAFQSGAPSDAITAYANWSSSVLFDKYYRLGTRSGINFSTAILPAAKVS